MASGAAVVSRRPAAPGVGPVQISRCTVLSELSGRVEHFFYLSFPEKVKRPPAAQPGG